MRIVFDCRYTRTDVPDGITRFTSGLVGALGRLHPVVMLISDHEQLRFLPDLPWELAPSPTGPREPLVARRVNRLRPDVVFSPMQTMGSWGRRYALVLTVHDLIYYRHRTPPRHVPWGVRVLWRLYHLAWWPQRLLLDRADAVATVSRTTAELIAEHRLTHREVVVIPNAVEPGAETDDAPPGPRERLLVYMGSFMPYKNVDALVRAAAELPDYELHLMSPAPAGEEERLAALAPGARLVFHRGASDEAYRALLRRATALVTASRDEGFGIPLIEAMQEGTPVIASEIPIFREIAGDAAIFADPDDPSAFARAVRALEDESEWRRRSEAARSKAASYSWGASAERLLALLTRLAGNGSSRRRGRARGR